MTALFTLRGTTATLDRVKASVSPGLAGLTVTIDGKRNKAASREHAIRVRAALDALGVKLDREIRVTLPPERSSAGDLAIAAAVLDAIGNIPAPAGLLVGELSLGGELRAARGVIPAIRAAEREGLPWVVVPLDNRDEAQCAVRAGVTIPIYLARRLVDVRDFLRGFLSALEIATAGDPSLISSDLAWQDVPASCADAAEQIVKAVNDGAKVLLLVGPPGSGKTMIARRITSILPSPTIAERLEIDTIASAAGLGIPATERPFRAPHHTVSAGALIGGGDPVRPGEVTLAHGGVLFLDEIAEYRRDALEALATTIRRGTARIARTDGTVEMPAEPAVVVLAASPCPCGYHGTVRRVCTCSPERITRHEAALEAVRAKFNAVRIEVPEYSRRADASLTGG